MRVVSCTCLLGLCAAATSLFTGCSARNMAMTDSPATTGVRGTLRGGQSPVTNSTIQLYEVGTTGDGSAATPLLKSTVVTDGNGNFNISSLYTCPASDPLVYITATGGNPGLAPGSDNPNIAMMAALGPCNNLSSSSFVVINELTTIASVFNLAPYMASFSAIGSGSSDAAAMATAFSNVQEYVDTTNGTAPGPTLPVGSSASTTKLNTLGDVLAPCVNSAGGVAGDGSPCGLLFTFTTPASGPAPTDTIGAALSVALTPVNPNRFLSILVTPTAPFQPTIAGDPATWALQILALQSISVTPANPSVNNGSTIQVSATGTFPDSSTANLTNQVTWTSSNNSVATVSPTGLDYRQVTRRPCHHYRNSRYHHGKYLPDRGLSHSPVAHNCPGEPKRDHQSTAPAQRHWTLL